MHYSVKRSQAAPRGQVSIDIHNRSAKLLQTGASTPSPLHMSAMSYLTFECRARLNFDEDGNRTENRCLVKNNGKARVCLQLISRSHHHRSCVHVSDSISPRYLIDMYPLLLMPA
jgi:hypothetical protein